MSKIKELVNAKSELQDFVEQKMKDNQKSYPQNCAPISGCSVTQKLIEDIIKDYTLDECVNEYKKLTSSLDYFLSEIDILNAQINDAYSQKNAIQDTAEALKHILFKKFLEEKLGE